MASKSKYKYYAFISYSHNDSDWAKWLQHELEYYQLPVVLNGRSNVPQSFRPVFRDEDELSAGDLKPQIRDALADSNFLIVICSPKSASSSYVNGEIIEFIKIGKSRGEDYRHRIFPFIVEGKPHNKKLECFPEILNKLREDKTNPIELIAGDVNATGKNHAFVKILAGTLRDKGIQFNELWDRYEQEKIEEEKRKREERNKLLTVQSRYLAEKAEILLDNHDSDLAAVLLLEALPNKLDSIDERPLVIEAEAVLRRAYDSSSMKYIGSISEHDYAFSISRQRLLSHQSNHLMIWNTDNGSHVDIKLRPYTEIVESGFSPSNNYIYCLTKDYIYVWNAETLKVKIEKEIGDWHGLEYKQLVFFNDDESYICIDDVSGELSIKVDNDESIKESSALEKPVYDETRKKCPRKRYGEKNKSYTRLLVRDDHLYDIREDNRLFILSENRKGIDYYRTCYSDDEKYILIIYEDCIKVFDLAQDKCIYVIKDYFTEESHAIFGSRNSIIYLNGSNCLKRFDFVENITTSYDFESESKIQRLVYSEATDIIFLIADDGYICRISSDKEKLCISTTEPLHFVSPDSTFIVSVINTKSYGVNKLIRTRIEKDNNVINKVVVDNNIILESSAEIDKVVFSSDASRIAVIYRNCTLGIYETTTGKMIGKINGHNDYITDAQFLVNNHIICTSSEDCSIKIWDVNSNNNGLLGVIKTTTPVKHIRLSRNGSHILATHKNSISLYTVDNLKHLRSCRSSVLDAAIFDETEEKIIALGNGVIKIYDINSLKIIERIGLKKDSFSDSPVKLSLIPHSDFILLQYYHGSQIGIYNLKTSDYIDADFNSRHLSMSIDGEILILNDTIYQKLGGMDAPFIKPVKEGMTNNQDADYFSSIMMLDDISDENLYSTIDDAYSKNQLNLTDINFQKIMILEYSRQRITDIQDYHISSNAFCSKLKPSGKASTVPHVHSELLNSVLQAIPPDSDDSIPSAYSNYNDVTEGTISGKYTYALDADDRQSICIVNKEANKVVAKYTCNDKYESIRDIIYIDDKNLLAYMTESYIYVKVFKPLQQLIDEVYNRYRTRAITEQEKEQYYLEGNVVNN